MSMPNAIQQFTIEHGVMNRAKDRKLGFVRDLRRVARHQGVQLDARLGMASVELVRKGRMRDITLEHPSLTIEPVREIIEDELAYKGVAGLGRDKIPLRLGRADVFAPIHEAKWVGLPVIDNEGILARNSLVVSQVLSAMSGGDVELEPTEYFLNIGKLYEHSPTGLDEVLDHIDRKKPDTVDVYSVAIRAADLYIPPQQ